LNDVFVVDACRSPFGRYRGQLAGIRPDDLLAGAIRGLFERQPQADPALIENVYAGAANQAGEDNRNVARMGALLAGLPIEVPGATVNRLCGSGLEAVNQAWFSLAMGGRLLAVGAGVESMSRAPFVLPRADERLSRSQELVDSKLGWRLVNPRMPREWTVSLGETAEIVASEFAVSREDQDIFALRSHEKAVAARSSGLLAREIVSGTPKDAALQKLTDECPRSDTSLESLSTLPASFVSGGTVTAGNSSGLSDGAAAVLLATERGLDEMNLTPIARMVAVGTAGVEPQRMGIGPVPAMKIALSRAGWTLESLRVVELNEAFAAQAVAVSRTLGLDDETVNRQGGAIALGHPLGASGARLVTTLVHQLSDLPSGSRGAATMCVGVGQGIATLVERV
jgi:acetyl-CoA acetyltransferase family protein